MKSIFLRLLIVIGLFLCITLGTFLILKYKSDNESKQINATVITTASTETDAITSEPELSQVPVEETTNVSESETTAPETVFDEDSTSPTKLIITARDPKEYDNNSVYISMENILQNPELPVGCEITSLTMMLRYLGFNAEKTDMAKNYLPISAWGNAQYKDGELYKDSFFDYFIGDPFSRGYGCFSNAIEKAANDYIADNGGGYTVINLSGSSPDVLYDYIAEGVPVICWATDGMIEPEYYESWYDNKTGKKLDWYLNEHCFILAGFDMERNVVTLNDPMKGIIDYDKTRFEKRYVQMYSQAIVILKDNENTDESVSSIEQ